VRSDRVAERVVQILGLDKDPAEIARWKEEGRGVGSVASWLARELQAGLDVKPARESNIINISWTGGSPQQASKVANAFAQAYLDTGLDLKTDPAKRYKTFFEDQLKVARDNFEKAQQRLSAYQQQAGITSTAEDLDHETARLNALSQQLTLIQAQTTEAAGKRASGRDTTTEVMQSPLINSLKADVARLEGKVQEAAGNLGPSHPQMQRMQSELASLRTQLTQQTGSIATSIDTSYQVGKSRENELAAALAAQKAKVLSINKDRGELSVLRRDVEQAQKAYEAVSVGFSQSRLQSLTNQTNVMRLAEAAEPVEASGPTSRQALLIAALGGILLALAGVLLAELANRRVRSADDLAMAAQLPVLASVPATSAIFTAPRLPGVRHLALGRSHA
ncbi:MAG TPA: chain length determinant protein EpsF, partial [Ramlibacter sp.]|nr:chain length determinant protein EpsF [Ramlibacter sp.]